MSKIGYVLWLLLILSAACHRKATKTAAPIETATTKVVSSDVDAEDEALMKKGPEQPEQVDPIIVLVCQFIAPLENEQVESKIEDCQNKSCRAKVKVISVVQDNTSFNGTFGPGDNIALGFDQSYDLAAGDYFEAHVYGETWDYRVKQYEKR
ncbi:MAG: hypothetical protein R2813_11775 [Flavobacteriales bacterium]